MTDKRQRPLNVEQYRDLITPSYQSIIMTLMGNHANQISVHSFNTDKVITRSNMLDPRTVVPSMFSMEMTEVNHAKFYPVGEEFAAVGMYLGFRTSQMQGGDRVSNHNAINRELTIGWDRMGLVGEYGNKGLLQKYPNDTKRIAMADAALPAYADDNFGARAKAVKKLGVDLKNEVNKTSASNDLTVLVFGTALQEYLSDSNYDTDITNLYDHLLKGFGKKNVDIVEVPARALEDSTLANINGITVISNGSLGLDTVGYPGLDKIGEDSSEAGDFDWSRFAVGSVQFKTDIKGGIINQIVTIS